MADLTLQTLPINGIQMRVATQGSGPLVLLCHGFPEGWVSWRSQLAALAAALSLIALGIRCRIDISRAQVWRTTSDGFLSSRMATKVQCLKCPASVHSTKCNLTDEFRLDLAAFFHFLCG